MSRSTRMQWWITAAIAVFVVVVVLFVFTVTLVRHGLQVPFVATAVQKPSPPTFTCELKNGQVLATQDSTLALETCSWAVEFHFYDTDTGKDWSMRRRWFIESWSPGTTESYAVPTFEGDPPLVVRKVRIEGIYFVRENGDLWSYLLDQTFDFPADAPPKP